MTTAEFLSKFGTQQALHLIGRALYLADDGELRDAGITDVESANLDTLFAELDDHLTVAVGHDWADREAL